MSLSQTYQGGHQIGSPGCLPATGTPSAAGSPDSCGLAVWVGVTVQTSERCVWNPAILWGVSELYTP